MTAALRPDSSFSPRERSERMAWAAEAVEAALNGEPEPEPPESIKRERERRARRRQAVRCRERAVAEGVVEAVPFDERCVGLGPACVHCREPLPSAGDPHKRCPRGGGL